MTLPVKSHPPGCPDCGSAEAIWRRRRWYNVALSWLRFLSFVDQVGYTPTPKSDATGEFEHDWPRQGLEMQADWIDEQRRELAMPSWYWRCKACGHTGVIYDY